MVRSSESRKDLGVLCFSNELSRVLDHLDPEFTIHDFRAFFSGLGFPGGSDSKESACNAGDQRSIPGLQRSPGEGMATPFKYLCLENSMDRGAGRATIHAVPKS